MWRLQTSPRPRPKTGASWPRPRTCNTVLEAPQGQGDGLLEAKEMASRTPTLEFNRDQTSL